MAKALNPKQAWKAFRNSYGLPSDPSVPTQLFPTWDHLPPAHRRLIAITLVKARRQRKGSGKALQAAFGGLPL